MEFSRQECWGGFPVFLRGIFPTRMEPRALLSPSLAGMFVTTSATWEALTCTTCLLFGQNHNLPAMWEIWVWSLRQEDPLEEDMATHFSILARRIPRIEEPGGLLSMGLQNRTWLRATNTSVQSSRSVMSDSVTPWTTVHQPSQSITNSWKLLKLVHQVGDAIQPAHRLSSPSLPTFNLSQHQGLFQWVSSSAEWEKINLQMLH